MHIICEFKMLIINEDVIYFLFLFYLLIFFLLKTVAVFIVSRLRHSIMAEEYIFSFFLCVISYICNAYINFVSL
jgi:hypothetical protein